jgi:general secretion pathway protein A
VILCGDLRLPERLAGPDLAPIGSRIKARYRADSASKDELRSAIEQRLDAAGNPTLMTEGLLATVCDHSSGNYRVLMQTCDELLVYGASKDAKQLDEKLFLDLYQEQQPRQRKQNHRRN